MVGIGRTRPHRGRLHRVSRQRRAGVPVTMASRGGHTRMAILVPTGSRRRSSEVTCSSAIGPGGTLADIGPPRRRPVDGRVHGFVWFEPLEVSGLTVEN